MVAVYVIPHMQEVVVELEPFERLADLLSYIGDRGMQDIILVAIGEFVKRLFDLLYGSL